MSDPYWYAELFPGALEDGAGIETASPEKLPDGAFNPDGRYFISYRSVDGGALADEFQTRLRAAGLIAWRDRADLSPGQIRRRLLQALTGAPPFAGSSADGRRGGLAGGVLIATPNVWSSLPVRTIEAPYLLQLEREHDDFQLLVANAVPAFGTGPADVEGPDQVYGLAPGTLSSLLLHDATSESGREEVVRKLLAHRIQYRLSERNPGTPVSINVNTRQSLRASETPAKLDSAIDLTVRTHMSRSRRWPARAALEALVSALAAMNDYLPNDDLRLEISGSMHPSVALAFGATFGRLRATTDCYHVREGVGSHWKSTTGAPRNPRRFTTRPERPEKATTGRVLVLVVMTYTAADQRAFDELERRATFDAVHRIELEQFDPIQADEGNDLARRLSEELTNLARSGELHLAYVGPWALALHLGRHLNTIQYVTYEWDNQDAFSPRYAACLRVNAGGAVPLAVELPTEEDPE